MDLITLLLVDDNPTFLRIITRFLHEQHAAEVQILGTARGGKEALAKVAELNPQIVLLDLSMAILPGLETIPLLRQARPQLGIIVVTLLETAAYRKAALEAGADDFVPKATLHDDLLPAIRRVAQQTAGRLDPPPGEAAVQDPRPEDD